MKEATTLNLLKSLINYIHSKQKNLKMAKALMILNLLILMMK